MALTDSEIKAAIPMLESVPIFSSLNKKSLKQIAQASTKRVFESGRLVVKQGDAATAFYLILDGAVEVRGGKKVLSKLGPGQFFGEMALLDKQPRSADVVAVGDTTCLLLTSWAFEGVVSANWSVARNLMKELMRRLRETDRALSE